MTLMDYHLSGRDQQVTTTFMYRDTTLTNMTRLQVQMHGKWGTIDGSFPQLREKMGSAVQKDQDKMYVY